MWKWRLFKSIKNKFTLHKAQSLNKREDILPFVHKSYELISKNV